MPQLRRVRQLVRERARKLGAEVSLVEVSSREGVDAAPVAEALERDPAIALVVFVHAESLSGNVNPAGEICRVVRAHGALCLLDAVASIGAHPLEVSTWGIDVCIAGPQKALAGSSGTSLVSVSERAWQAMRDNPTAPRGSFLSLLDWKDRWIDAGRKRIPGTPSVVEMLALEAACARVLDEGLDQVVARHERSARGCRAGVRALGLEPARERPRCRERRHRRSRCRRIWMPTRQRRSHTPHGLALVAGRGALAGKILRLDHMGGGASPEAVLAALIALGEALRDSGLRVGSTGAAGKAGAALL